MKWRCLICGASRMVDQPPVMGRHYMDVHYKAPSWLLRSAGKFTTPTPASDTVIDRRAVESGRRVPGWRRRAAATDES